MGKRWRVVGFILCACLLMGYRSGEWYDAEICASVRIRDLDGDGIPEVLLVESRYVVVYDSMFLPGKRWFPNEGFLKRRK